MVVNTIIDFADYLNNNGYAITSDKINMSLKSIEDISSIESFSYALKPYFCSTITQYHLFDDYFKSFIKNKELIEKQNELKEKKRKAENSMEGQKSAISDEIENIEKEIAEKSKAAMASIKDHKSINKKDIEFILNKQDEITSLPFTMIPMTLIKSLLYALKNGEQLPTMPGAAKQACTEITQMSEQALLNGQKERFQFLKTLNDICQKLQKIDISKGKKVKEKVKNDTKDLNKKKKELLNKLQDIDDEYEKIQEELDSLLKQSQVPIILKEASINHRDEFIGGTRAVQLIGDGIPEVMKTKFSSLDDVEIIEIYQYIKKNILRFKTRLQKSIYAQLKKEIDIEKTIQKACKTGGLPLELINKQPKVNRAKLLLCLDISGSCKEASKMMLAFMYLLKSVFPAGCKTYVFVNKLHDISSIMESRNILTAIDSVLNTIPTRGIYSNYYKPLTELWTEHKSEITPETFVIFIGDARNNKNHTGDEYIKNIARRAKKCVWLNTDIIEKWGQGDSIAQLYAKYTKMYEVVNPMQLIDAINII